MDKVNTTDKLLGILISQGKAMDLKIDKLSESNFNLSLKVSNLLNKQEQEGIYFRGILEGNPNTHQKGLFEQVQDNVQDISTLKVDKKVTAGKIGVAGAIFTVIGTFVLKLMGVIKFIF